MSLDDASEPKCAASALDFLLIELVPLAQRITERLHAQEAQLVAEYQRSRAFSQQQPQKNISQRPEVLNGDGLGKDGVGKGVGKGAKGQGEEDERELDSLGFPVMDEGIREGVFWRLDGLGYRVGQGLVERFSINKPRPTTPLDAIKFICKDLWTLVFKKQIDNLKTNHRGIFVLTDTRFQPLSRVSTGGAEEAVRRAQTYLYFPCGVIRGALAGLGVEASVEASSAEIPLATFQIKTKGAKA